MRKDWSNIRNCWRVKSQRKLYIALWRTTRFHSRWRGSDARDGQIPEVIRGTIWGRRTCKVSRTQVTSYDVNLRWHGASFQGSMAQEYFYAHTTAPANSECESQKGKDSLAEVQTCKTDCCEERPAAMGHIHPQPLRSLSSPALTTKSWKNISRHQDSYPVRGVNK